MLTHLYISRYALIDTLDVEFTPGLSTITGETGAGKSIMLGALSLLLGQRADSRKAAPAAEGKTVVEGTFDISSFPHLTALLEECELDAAEDSLMILRREIAPTGRSRAFINDSPVSLQVMNRVASHLIDIHSQHANLLLANPAWQLNLIDAYADNAAERRAYRELYEAYRSLRSRIATLKTSAAHARENEEFIAFRLEHLRKLKPEEGELERLEARQQILADAGSISENIAEARALLADSDVGILDSLAQVINALHRVNPAIFADDPELTSRVESARIDLADIASSLEDYLDRVEADPSELERTEARIDELYEAQRRFNVASEAELIELHKALEKEYAMLTDDDTDIPALEQELHALGARLKEVAAKLRQTRIDSIETISRLLLELARPLGLANLRLAFSITTAKLTSTGGDMPSLLVAFNKNQELRPVEQVASGGEISRLMLCLKALMARRMQLPTIIFDEVDTGVSGDIADRMGALMRTMSADMQVLTITHLPQVAAKGASQYKVYKSDTADATHTHMRRLTPEEREEEIAAMLSGADTSEAARHNARELLRNL
ncbi:MAG: DNA repair protein RecN [Bacteroidales bacterium]|nr:DNA repair protein RecN [Bacteroidales bacterium]